jgi:hypothetical protein
VAVASTVEAVTDGKTKKRISQGELPRAAPFFLASLMLMVLRRFDFTPRDA